MRAAGCLAKPVCGQQQQQQQSVWSCGRGRGVRLAAPLSAASRCLLHLHTSLRPHSRDLADVRPVPRIAAPGISASPSEDNLRYFNVMILGPQSSPFEGTVPGRRHPPPRAARSGLDASRAAGICACSCTHLVSVQAVQTLRSPGSVPHRWLCACPRCAVMQ